MSDSEMDVSFSEVEELSSNANGASDVNGTSINVDMRCNTCNEAFDGLSRAPSTRESGKIQCMKCNEDGTSVKSVFLTPRDLLSPEPEDKGGNGEGTSGDFRNKTQQASALAEPSLEVAGSASSEQATAIAEPSLEVAGSASSDSDITIKCINGATVKAKVPNSTKVQALKKTVHQQTGIAVERQHLLYRGKNLNDSKTIKESNIRNGDTLQMANKCYGG